MSNNKAEITEFGVVGELEGEQIHYKEGKKEYGNYLRYKNINFSINHKFYPLNFEKCVKIINYKLEKVNSKNNLEQK
jgi:hypothetical protein